MHAAKEELKNYQPCKQHLNHLSLSLHYFFFLTISITAQQFTHVVASYTLKRCVITLIHNVSSTFDVIYASKRASKHQKPTGV